jgi:hypothetical protein
MRRLALQIFLVVMLTGTRVTAAQITGQNSATVSTPDASRLQLGTFEYRDLDHGKQVGEGEITIRRCGRTGRYEFSAKASFSEGFRGFHSQEWRAVTTSGFKPVVATLNLMSATETKPVFELQYQDREVTGSVVRYNGCPSGCKQPVHGSISPDTVDQRIDWAAVLSSDLTPGHEIEFSVYDPISGISRIKGRVGSTERVRVPAGDFSAVRVIYQMEKAAGAEHFQLLATQSLPHIMVREEFPNGVVTELTRITTGRDSGTCTSDAF